MGYLPRQWSQSLVKLDSIFNVKIFILSKKLVHWKEALEMKKQNIFHTPSNSKRILINLLFIADMIIIFLGIFFSIFSLVNDVHIKVLSSFIPGTVFGLLVLYLGIRYYFSLTKLKEELFKSSSKFSWNNFKWKKKKKFSYKK